jgi:hypothetical protein
MSYKYFGFSTHATSLSIPNHPCPFLLRRTSFPIKREKIQDKKLPESETIDVNKRCEKNKKWGR